MYTHVHTHVYGMYTQVLLKWWYARTLLELNYHIVFSDPDIAWLAPPFARWQRSFDLQGLSDIRSTNLTVQKHHEITCMRPWMEAMYEHGRRSIYPCQSTGLWYMRNRPQAHAMLDGLYGYLRAKPNEWEQKAFQLLVMRYLVGLGDELPPLRYRLLPTSQVTTRRLAPPRTFSHLPSRLLSPSLTATGCCPRRSSSTSSTTARGARRGWRWAA